MKQFITHKLNIIYNLNPDPNSSHNQKVYKCEVCEVLLYEHFTLNKFYEVVSYIFGGKVDYIPLEVNLTCEEFIIKKIIE
jgi:hypothetical protein